MADISKLLGYNIKDASARSDIANIQSSLYDIDEAIGDIEEDVSGITERLDFYLQVNPIITSGTKIATISVENVDYDLYAPQGGGTSGIQSVSGTNSATCTTDASGNVTVDVSYITTGNETGNTPATRCTIEGLHNRASAPASHVEGTYNSISANATQCGHAEGSNNTVNGVNGHAEGNGNTVGGSNSHAEGNGNTVGGNCSHAEGDGNTTASSATCAHVGGYRSYAGGNSSIAQGYQVKTTNTGECAVGSFNKSDSLTRFSVGNGNSDNNRSNLFEVTSAGSAIVSGELHTGDDVYVGGQNIYINNASSVQKEISIDANNQLCVDSVPVASGGYVLPTASASTLGGVKVGSGLAIDGNGVLSATGGSGGSLPVLYDETGTEHVIGKVIDGNNVTKNLYRCLTTSLFNAITPAGIFASSWYDENERPEEAFDGNMSNGWLPSATSAPSYAGIHLSNAVVFGKCEVYISAKGSDSSDWYIEGSNDGTTWTRISNIIHPTSNGTHVMTTIDTTPYTYLRFYTTSGLCPSGSGGAFTRINEITFYSPSINNLDKIYDYKKTYFDSNLYIAEYTKTV